MAKRQPVAAAAPAPEQPRPKRPPPEMKFSVGGIGVAVWLNTVDTDQCERSFRSVTIAAKRYLDKTTGEWKNGTSFHPNDLPALIFCLQKTLEFAFTTPLPGQDGEAGQSGEHSEGDDGEVPF